jgi:Tfp pilus assembly protein PilN
VINLLPPSIKSEIRFAKWNRLALAYLRVLVAVVIALAGVFGWALWQLGDQEHQVAAKVADKQAAISKLSKSFLPKAKDASERLNAIKFVQTSQTHFSNLIADLVAVLPKDVNIEGLTLTGDEAKPVTMDVSAKSYDQVLALRNSLENSKRVANADIVSINNQSGSWTASVIIGFKPGQAK